MQRLLITIIVTAHGAHALSILARLIPFSSTGWSFTADSGYVCDELMVKMINMIEAGTRQWVVLASR